MYATYKPTREGLSLNVRKEPSSTAEVAGRMAAGEAVKVEAVERGWCKVEGGYVDARFVCVIDEAPEADETATEADETAAEAAEAEEPAEAGDEGAELMKMTNEQLVKLAEDSGIAVNSKATKAQLVAAILEGANE